jgi:hypothetical protein
MTVTGGNRPRAAVLRAVMSLELVGSITDAEGSAVLGAFSTCTRSRWYEIADVCPGTSTVNGIAVSRTGQNTLTRA